MTPSRPTTGRAAARGAALFIGLVGLALAVGGARLITLGGSPYYAVTALLLLGSAIGLWRGRRAGLHLYGVMLALTLAWALWEAGTDGWALMPRLAGPLIVGGVLLLPAIRRPLQPPPSPGRWRTAAVVTLAALLAGTLLHLVAGPARPDPAYRNGTGAAPAPRLAAAAAGVDWGHYGGDAGGARFSALAQINVATVGGLREAWRVRLGDAGADARAGLQVTPLKVGDTLYACNGRNDVFAIDAEIGAKRWQFRSNGRFALNCRGVLFFRAPATVTDCPTRIITATADARLIALDARSGRRCAGFGRDGIVDLRDGLGDAPIPYYFVTSAPALVRGRVVLGGWVMDGQYWGEPSGVIRAFDAVTGQLAWAYDAGRPDRRGRPPAGETYTPATPNSWGPISADERLGLVYLPTGNATPDYFGAQRRRFDDAISSSVLAIDAATGRLRWSFQTVHHDVWDYDVASQPSLVDLRTVAGVRPALALPTKRGEIFVLDRATGRPIAPVVERPVPQAGKVPEERLSPTQPESVGMPSLRGPDLDEASMWGLTPLDQLWCRIRFREARYDGPFTPLGTTPSLIYPGTQGGVNWGGLSIDRDRGVAIVNASRFPTHARLLPRAEADAMGLKPMARTEQFATHIRGPKPQANTPYGVVTQPFLSPLGVPCHQPPYGTLSAIDLASGRLIWTQPLGSARGSGPFGIGSRLPFTLGTPNTGGSLTTRGGLAFIAATQDLRLRAFETVNGRLLWEAPLPAGGNASPMTYASPASGRQFVVIAAGGSGGIMTRQDNLLVAYALPRERR